MPNEEGNQQLRLITCNFPALVAVSYDSSNKCLVTVQWQVTRQEYDFYVSSLLHTIAAYAHMSVQKAADISILLQRPSTTACCTLQVKASSSSCFPLKEIDNHLLSFHLSREQYTALAVQSSQGKRMSCNRRQGYSALGTLSGQ